MPFSLPILSDILILKTVVILAEISAVIGFYRQWVRPAEWEKEDLFMRLVHCFVCAAGMAIGLLLFFIMISLFIKGLIFVFTGA